MLMPIKQKNVILTFWIIGVRCMAAIAWQLQGYILLTRLSTGRLCNFFARAWRKCWVCFASVTAVYRKMATEGKAWTSFAVFLCGQFWRKRIVNRLERALPSWGESERSEEAIIFPGSSFTSATLEKGEFSWSVLGWVSWSKKIGSSPPQLWTCARYFAPETVKRFLCMEVQKSRSDAFYPYTNSFMIEIALCTVKLWAVKGFSFHLMNGRISGGNSGMVSHCSSLGGACQKKSRSMHCQY